MTKDKRIELPDEIFKKAYALKSDGNIWHTSIFKTHQIAAEFIAKFGMDIQMELLD